MVSVRAYNGEDLGKADEHAQDKTTNNSNINDTRDIIDSKKDLETTDKCKNNAIVAIYSIYLFIIYLIYFIVFLSLIIILQFKFL